MAAPLWSSPGPRGALEASTSGRSGFAAWSRAASARATCNRQRLRPGQEEPWQPALLLVQRRHRRGVRLHPPGTYSRNPTGEVAFNLSEYLVTLDKPIGLTLAPDPVTGQIVVQHIQEGLPAANSRLIQVGDVLKACSSVFGDDMWDCQDIQRTRWAINNRTGKVKLVLERRKRSPDRSTTPTPPWYCAGKVGLVSCDEDNLQLPIDFSSPVAVDSLDLEGGKGCVLQVAFHRSTQMHLQQKTQVRASFASRMARTDQLRLQLMDARCLPELDLSLASPSRIYSPPLRDGTPSPSPGGASTQPPMMYGQAQNDAVPFRRAAANTGAGTPGGGNSRGAPPASVGGGQRADSAAPTALRDKTVTQFLHWMLLCCTRLSAVELTRLASQRSLGGVLEMRLQAPNGALCIGNCCSTDPATSRPAALVAVAASLQRLVTRRRYSPLARGPLHGCALLLICEGVQPSDVGALLAGWLHWYGGLGRDEAVQAVRANAGLAVAEPLLSEATRLLVDGARERFSRVSLNWPYGGVSAEVSGELAGGWDKTIPMQRLYSAPRSKAAYRAFHLGHFTLELQGLRPGLYHYKYIIDGTWAVDPFAPKDTDQLGNWNNVLEVHEAPHIDSEAAQLHFARLQAACLAYSAKMR